MIWILFLILTIVFAFVFPPLAFLFGIVIVFNVFKEELES